MGEILRDAVSATFTPSLNGPEKSALVQIATYADNRSRLRGNVMASAAAGSVPALSSSPWRMAYADWARPPRVKIQKRHPVKGAFSVSGLFPGS